MIAKLAIKSLEWQLDIIKNNQITFEIVYCILIVIIASLWIYYIVKK